MFCQQKWKISYHHFTFENWWTFIEFYYQFLSKIFGSVIKIIDYLSPCHRLRKKTRLLVIFLPPKLQLQAKIRVILQQMNKFQKMKTIRFLCQKIKKVLKLKWKFYQKLEKNPTSQISHLRNHFYLAHSEIFSISGSHSSNGCITTRL